MPLDYRLSDKLKQVIQKLQKKDPHRAEILYKKIKQIVNSDETTIQHYKNLRFDYKDRKRVHVDRSFVLTFKYEKDKKLIRFLDFDHHDNVYKK